MEIPNLKIEQNFRPENSGRKNLFRRKIYFPAGNSDSGRKFSGRQDFRPPVSGRRAIPAGNTQNSIINISCYIRDICFGSSQI
jgi:hypothetical protein